MDLNVNFPIDDVELIGSKNKYGFDSVLLDFKNAKEIRILTYSKISGNVLERLRDLSGNVDIKIIIAPAGLPQKKVATT